MTPHIYAQRPVKYVFGAQKDLLSCSRRILYASYMVLLYAHWAFVWFLLFFLVLLGTRSPISADRFPPLHAIFHVLILIVGHIGANAGVLCYDITDPSSFEEMGRWLKELKQNLGDDIILHIVGTKSDIVAEDPSRRLVPFERCIAYVAENLYPNQIPQGQNPPPGWQSGGMSSPQSNRSSGFWGQEIGWDCCHEISAKDGEGVDEVFRVITRKLVEQQQRKMEEEQRQLALAGLTPGVNGNGGINGYFDYPGAGNGSFRVGHGDKRRSWMFPTTPNIGAGESQEWVEEVDRMRKTKGGKCC
jgi:hypothetical protein